MNDEALAPNPFADYLGDGYQPQNTLQQTAQRNRSYLTNDDGIAPLQNLPTRAERYAMAPNESGLPPLSIGGDAGSLTNQAVTHSIDSAKKTMSNVQQHATDQTNGFLGFLLLCSIGLNIYLLWISRGFYVRYSELADELRETFTTTM